MGIINKEKNKTKETYVTRFLTRQGYTKCDKCSSGSWVVWHGQGEECPRKYTKGEDNDQAHDRI